MRGGHPAYMHYPYRGEPGDQNAGTHLYPHGWWSLGPDGDGWAVEVIETNAHGDEMPLGGASLGWFATKQEAKGAAEAFERGEDPLARPVD